MNRKLAVAIATGLAALAVAAPAQAGQVVTATPGGTPAELAFNSGVNSSGAYSAEFKDRTIWNQLIGLLNRAPAGSWVGLTVHTWDAAGADVLTAISDATERGVHTYVVDDEMPMVNSFNVEHYRPCGLACLSNNSNPGSIMHAKFAIFSMTKRRDGTAAPNTSWVTSANLDDRTGQSEFNNAIVYYDNAQLYNVLAKIFQDMYNGPVVFESSPGASDADYYNPAVGRGYANVSSAATEVYMAPERSLTRSLWYDRVHQISAPTAGHPCTIRVMQSLWSDGLYDQNEPNDPASELARLGGLGCDVRIVVHRKDDTADNGYWGDARIDPHTLNELCSAPNVYIKTLMRVHDKFMISSSYPSGSSSAVPQIVTGSPQMTVPATRYSDELMIRLIGTPAIYNAYLTHWNEAWNNGRPILGC